MATIDYKEKYEKAVHAAMLAKQDTESTVTVQTLEEIFPELKENEDELTWLKRFIKEEIDCLSFDIRDSEDRVKLKNLQRSIAWLEKQGNLMKCLQIANSKIGDLIEENYYLRENLEKQGNNMGISEATKQKLEDNLNKALEKETTESWNKFLDEQGEQKPTDKFHEGDWVVISTSDGEKVVQIDSIEYFKNGKPRYITSEGRWFSNGTKAHLWTIQDAKDGDVLVTCGCILIFEKHLPKDGGVSYCHYDCVSSTPQFDFTKDYNWYFGKEAEVYPATKEQREFLFQKMKEAGYEWNAENKELKKIKEKKDIHNKLTAFEFSLKHIIEEAIECGDTHNLKADADMLLRLVQKSSWSEEDEELLDNTIKFIEDRVAATSPSLRTYSPTLTGKEIPFLKALKDRVQPKQEWSEEDNRMCKAIIDNIQAICEEGYFVGNIDSDELIKWLKFLKDRYTWRPSDEQMDALHYVTNFDYGGHKATLVSLYEQLKKLKG